MKIKNMVSHSKIKVAVVEDNHFIRLALSQIIEEAVGYELLGEYSNAEDAVDGIIANPPDVVLMDINLGKMNGIDAIRLIRLENSEVLFLMCTVYEDDEKIFEALSAGAKGYILKKTSPEKLITAVYDIYCGGAPMTSQIANKVVSFFVNKKHTVNVNFQSLSQRENEILTELVKGNLYKEIGAKFGISPETVKKHVYHIYKKLEVNNRLEAYNKVFPKKNN